MWCEFHTICVNNTYMDNNKVMHLSPAEYVIKVFGGVRKTARAIGRTAPSISKWQKARDNKGTGGRVPTAAAEIILQIAQRDSLDITASDLLLGRDICGE